MRRRFLLGVRKESRRSAVHGEEGGKTHGFLFLSSQVVVATVSVDRVPG